MMLTTAMANTRTRRAHLRRAGPARLEPTLDAVILAAAAVVCAALFLQGGLEALMGAAAGAVIAARTRSQSITSGAFAGLWIGALFAGFFHGALVALVRTLL